MRHKYVTSALVLARYPLAEASLYLALLTPELGLVRARVQGVRRPGAKLTSALQTLCECEIVLVRGKEGWRVSGAVLTTNWCRELTPGARMRVSRVALLLLRLVRGETYDAPLYQLFTEFVYSLPKLAEPEQDAAECLVALRLLQLLGHDAGEIPGGVSGYEPSSLMSIRSERASIVARVNNGISASGL